GLLLGRTYLIERRDGRFVVRARDEIERLLKCAYDGEPPVDRLMSGLARVASALNANDQCLARIAAVHLQMPDLASAAVRWVQDPEQTVEFPPGTTLDQVIDRMIAILQEAARTYPEVDQGCSQSVSPAGYES